MQRLALFLGTVALGMPALASSVRSDPPTPTYHCYLVDEARPNDRVEFVVATTEPTIVQRDLGSYRATVERFEGVDSDGRYNILASIHESAGTMSEIGFAVGVKWTQVRHESRNHERLLLACSTWE